MKAETVQMIRDFLLNKINPVFIIVFGSYAKGSTHQDSDIDVAFFSEDSHLTSYDLFFIAQELADILKMEVDLVDVKKASTVFKSQIYTTGVVIYSKDETLLQKQQMTSLSMYAKLNEERAGILKNINESGCIYEK
jgi:predicted nucleotidyltransferase